MNDADAGLHRQLDRLQQEVRERRRAEEQLRQSEERFRSLVEHAQDVIYRLRLQPRVRFEYVSPAVAHVLGVTAGELYENPHHARDFVHPDDRGRLDTFIGGGDFTQPLALRWRRADGHEMWLQQHALPVFDDEGRLLVLEGIVRDVSGLRHVLEGIDDRTVSAAERNRLMTAFERIGSATMASLELDDVLDTLAEQVVRAGIFRSLMIAIVDHQSNTVQVARNYVSFSCYEDGIGRIQPGAELIPFPSVVHRDGERHIFSDHRIIGTTYDLDDDNITPTVARTGELTIIEGWDDRFDAASGGPEHRENSVALFIPIVRDDRVLAVMATGGEQQQKDEMRRRVDIMAPLLDQVAIALDHALLFGRVRDHVAELAELNNRLRLEVSRRQQAEQALREFSVRTIHLQEEERRRVARELHDGVNQLLCAVGFGLESAARDAGPCGDPQGQFESTRQLLDQTIREVRRISHGLRPGVLDDLGLLPAIRSLCEEVQERADFEISHDLRDESDPIPQEMAITLYRLLQEAFFCIERRGGQAEIQVRFQTSKEGFLLEIATRDHLFGDGKTAPDVLASMRARAGLVGGRVDLVTGDDGGQCLRLRLPAKTLGVLNP